MTDVRSVSLPDAYSDWVNEHVGSLSDYVQTKIEDDADGEIGD